MKTRSLKKSSVRGFSLIEVTIALGIVAFAMVPIIGLVSTGMKSLRDSMDETVRGEIVRKVSGEALRIPYTRLLEEFQNKTFYFNDEGIQQTSSNASTIFVATTALAAPPSLLHGPGLKGWPHCQGQ